MSDVFVDYITRPAITAGVVRQRCTPRGSSGQRRTSSTFSRNGATIVIHPSLARGVVCPRKVPAVGVGELGDGDSQLMKIVRHFVHWPRRGCTGQPATASPSGCQ